MTENHLFLVNLNQELYELVPQHQAMLETHRGLQVVHTHVVRFVVGWDKVPEVDGVQAFRFVLV